MRIGCAALSLSLGVYPVAAHQPHDPIKIVAVSPNYNQDNTAFVGTDALTIPLPISEYVPMVSTNGGFTYTVMPGLPNQATLSIGISPGYSTDGTVFMAGAGGLWKSTNRGASWSPVGGTALASGVQAVALTPNFTGGGTVFAVTASLPYGSSDHGTTWQALPAPSPLSSSLTALSVSPNYAVDHELLLGTAADGIFRSNSYGHSWTAVTTGMTLPSVTGFAFSPAFATDHTVFASTLGSGVLISTDSGTTWAAANNGITDLNGNAIAISPSFAQDGTVWVASAAGGVFRTTNRGSAWAVCAPVPRPLSDQTTNHFITIASGPGTNGPVLYLGMYEGLWISTDAGNTWMYGDILPTRLVRDLKLSPSYSQDQTVFASTYGGGTLWSTNGGSTWAFKNTGLANQYTDAAEMSPNYLVDQTAWIGTTVGLARISGGSTKWGVMTMLGAPTYPRSLGASPGFAQDSTIFIGTHDGVSYPPFVTYNGKQVPNQGLFTSTNAGQNWIPAGIAGPPVDAIAVSPSFPTDHTLFAGSATKGLFKSIDGGVTFNSIVIVPTDMDVLRMALSPAYASDQTVFAATSHSGVFKSTDGGVTWNKIPGSDLAAAFSIAVSPNYPSDQTLFLGTLQQGLLKSTDGGNTLIPTSLPSGTFATAVAISPGFAQDRTVFAASYVGLYKSTDAGNTWVYTNEPARQEELRSFPTGIFSTIVYQGSWPANKNTAYSTQQLVTTTQSGATASLTFLGSGAEWVGLKSTSGGTAQVILDGVLDATVNLSSTKSLPQQVLWQHRGLTCGVHTVTIKATPAAGKNVTLDALDVWQDTCGL